MGEVYRATDTNLKRQVAIKVPVPTAATITADAATAVPSVRQGRVGAGGVTETRTTYVGSLDDAARIKVLISQFMVEFAEPGWLLFVQEGALVAQRFDIETLRLTGAPTQLAKSVAGSLQMAGRP